MESDFEIVNLDKSRLGFFRKTVKNTSPFIFNSVNSMSFFFIFCNIINIDLFSIHRFLLVFWIFTGTYGAIIKFKMNLRLGINYYHFIVNYTMKKRKFYYILSFLLDDFLDKQFWTNTKCWQNSYILFFEDLEILTNFKLARGVYFHRIQQKFFLEIKFWDILSNFSKFFLNSLKLYVI